MKNVVVAMLIIIASVCLCVACGTSGDNQYLRIHIRANSNSYLDQEVKYKVKDKVVDYLTPILAECDSYDSVVEAVNSHKTNLEKVCDDVLMQEGFDYTSSVEINNEYFPTRTYENFTLGADFYNALIIKLGEGVGDNWWCVVYPPLCFKDTNNIVYKSKIMEIIQKVFNV